MKQKLNPIAAAVIILAAAGIVFAIMWRASEAPKWNRLPPAMSAGPPGGMPMAAPHKLKGHSTVSGHEAAGHSDTNKPPARSKADTGNAEK